MVLKFVKIFIGLEVLFILELRRGGKMFVLLISVRKGVGSPKTLAVKLVMAFRLDFGLIVGLEVFPLKRYIRGYSLFPLARIFRWVIGGGKGSGGVKEIGGGGVGCLFGRKSFLMVLLTLFR
jgi:hypothetical protein